MSLWLVSEKCCLTLNQSVVQQTLGTAGSEAKYAWKQGQRKTVLCTTWDRGHTLGGLLAEVKSISVHLLLGKLMTGWFHFTAPAAEGSVLTFETPLTHNLCAD